MSEPRIPQAMRLGEKLRAAADWLQSTSNAARYLFFFLSLQYLFATPYFWSETPPQTGTILTEGKFTEYLWAYSDLLVTLLGGVFAVSQRMRMVVAASLIAVIAVATTLASDVMQTKQLYVASDVAMIVFFLFTALVILHDVWTTRSVTLDTIVGSVCVYVLLGATWGFVYTLTELLSPGSFEIAASGRAVDQALLTARHYPLFMYYSFVTLTSVGYGDIIPAAPSARLLAAWEAIFGQFYMAVLVARLVAIHIARTTADAARADRSQDYQRKS